MGLLVGLVSACQSSEVGNSKSEPAVSTSVAREQGVWLGRRAVPISQIASEPESPILSWEVSAGDSVAGTVRRWSAIAGYTALPIFSATEDWTLIVSQSFVGRFEDALAWLSEGFQRQRVRPVAVLFANHTLDLVGQPTDAVARQ